VSDVDESAAIESLERLGLSNYEARVFVALQRLGVATAKEVHEVAGVPRSQVYGAADELVARGLLERQQSTPKRYRPVSLDAAKELISTRIEEERDRAFEFLEAVHREQRPEERREDVWTVQGEEAVSERVIELLGSADRRIVYGAADPDLVPDELLAALAERAEAGVDVLVLSEHPVVRAAFEEHGFEPFAMPPERGVDWTGRVLLVDDNRVLVSVRSPGGETAIWSADTAIADVLVQTIHSGISAVRRRRTTGTDRDGESAGSDGESAGSDGESAGSDDDSGPDSDGSDGTDPEPSSG